mgnify:FL=1
MNRKDRRGNKTTYLSGNTGIRLICEAVAVELLFYAMLAIFWSAFGWQLPIRALGKMQVAMLVGLFLCRLLKNEIRYCWKILKRMCIKHKRLCG